MDFKPHIYFEILCLLCCLLSLKHTRHSILFIFVFYLPVVLFTETSSYFIRYNNHWVYNGFILFQLFFFSFFFFRAIKSSFFKKVILLTSFVFLTFYLINLLFIQGFNRFNYYSIILVSLLLIIYAGRFMLQLADEENAGSFWRSPLFWISLSCLLFFSGSFMYFSAWDILVNAKTDKRGLLYNNLFQILNVLHYAMLSIGFLCPIIIRRK